MARPLTCVTALLLMLGWQGNAGAGEAMYQPKKNPFAQPDILKAKQPATNNQQNAKQPPKPTIPELKLTATLISVTDPMVIVNGELLRIGDKIEGMQLELIDEGRAVFLFRGKPHVYRIADDE